MIDDSSIGSGNYGWLGGLDEPPESAGTGAGEAGSSAHDIAHRIVVTGAYQMPFGKGRKFGGNVNRCVDCVHRWLGGERHS